jgi:transposase
MTKITKELKSRILSELDGGKSIRSIAKDVKLSKTTVGKISTKFNKRGLKQALGRPKLLSKKMLTYIPKKFNEGVFQNAVECQDFLKKNFDIKISSPTIRRYLKENKLKCYKKQPKPLLLPRHIKTRLNFCNLAKN